jgi:hypothetical protein
MLTRYSDVRQMLKIKRLYSEFVLFIVWEIINGTLAVVKFEEILNWPGNFQDGFSFIKSINKWDPEVDSMPLIQIIQSNSVRMYVRIWMFFIFSLPKAVTSQLMVLSACPRLPPMPAIIVKVLRPRA